MQRDNSYRSEAHLRSIIDKMALNLSIATVEVADLQTLLADRNEVVNAQSALIADLRLEIAALREATGVPGPEVDEDLEAKPALH